MFYCFNCLGLLPFAFVLQDVSGCGSWDIFVDLLCLLVFNAYFDLILKLLLLFNKKIYKYFKNVCCSFLLPK